jgi:predicted negative regulator of RcsB-dependent stress response
MSQDQTKMALDQLEVLCKEFSDTLWGVYGHYMAGRGSCEVQDWHRAERELLCVVDSPVEHPLMQPACLWAAQAQAELGKYTDAVACFRRALAHETKDPLTPKILYNIALCLERSDASPLEVEDRYMELRTRFPATEYAREADYRLARMALEAGKFRKAVARYEFYLGAWPVDLQRSREACRDLILAYVRTQDYVRAVLLGEIMCTTFGREREYREALPMLLEAYREAQMQQVGLDVITRSLAAMPDVQQQWQLKVEKADFLVALKRYDEAEAMVGQLRQEVEDPDLLWRLKLAEARILVGKGEASQGVRLCREVALKAGEPQTRAAALKFMGRCYELSKDFDKAALAYAGKCPADAGRSEP